MIAAFTATLPGFPAGAIEIDTLSVKEISAVKYLDADGAEQTLNAETYHTDLPGAAASDFLTTQIRPPADGWPQTQSGTDKAVTVSYTAGYAAAAADVPAAVNWALKLLAAHFYANRQGNETGTDNIPGTYAALLSPYRKPVI